MTYLYDGFLKIKVITSTIKGKIVKRESLVMKDAVASLVITEDNRIGLVKQFRPVPNRFTYELPAGVVDKDLSNEDILLEELQEECEIEKKDILSVEFLFDYYMSIGFSDGILNMYLIRVKNQENKKVSDVDVEEVIWVTKEKALDMIKTKEICDAKTILAINHYINFIG